MALSFFSGCVFNSFMKGILPGFLNQGMVHLPAWTRQMVPLGGERLIALPNAAGVNVVLQATGIATVTEAFATAPAKATGEQIRLAAVVQQALRQNPFLAGCRFFMLHGQAQGDVILMAGKLRLKIAVREGRTVMVAAHRVVDKGGPSAPATKRMEAEAAAMIAAANDILGPQANVWFELAGSCPKLTLKEVAGKAVHGQMDLPVVYNRAVKTDQMLPGDTTQHVIKHRQPGKRLNVFFVWSMYSLATYSDFSPVGVCIGSDVLISDACTPDQLGRTLAHEYLHSCGLDHHTDPDNLMAALQDAAGLTLNEEQSQKAWEGAKAAPVYMVP